MNRERGKLKAKLQVERGRTAGRKESGKTTLIAQTKKEEGDEKGGVRRKKGGTRLELNAARKKAPGRKWKTKGKRGGERG